MSGGAIGRIPWRRVEEFRWTLLRSNIALSASLSLFHTRASSPKTVKYWQEILRIPSLLEDVLYNLYTTQSFK
jgi:hypothetical protein